MHDQLKNMRKCDNDLQAKKLHCQKKKFTSHDEKLRQQK